MDLHRGLLIRACLAVAVASAAACSSETETDAGGTNEDAAARRDAAPQARDAGPIASDAGAADTGPAASDGGAADASGDAAVGADRSPQDTPDASSPDATQRDASAPDASTADAATPDASAPDASAPDAARPDATPNDAGINCPVVAVPPPDPDAWSVALPTIAPPTTRMVTSGGHTDLYLSGPAGVAEIGVRLDWGGTVVFFGQTGAPASNTIDANDTGRELQLAIYDPARATQGCAFNASCLTSNPCPGSITYLGWNPVQGGDECNHGARILGSGVAGDAMVVEVRPLQWNPDWDAPDCRQSSCGPNGVEVDVTYRLAFRFVHSHVVEIAMVIQSFESIDHAPTGQEFPTLYVGNGRNSTDLPLLLDSAGTPISVDQPANDGFTVKNFTSPGPWVTWQHTVRDYGVGLSMDNGIRDFQGWAGDGNNAPYFHNVRPIQAFGLGAGATVRGRAYLALGAFDTIRTVLTEVLGRRPPFGALDIPGGPTAPSAASLRVGGWVLDNTPGTTLVARLDGADLATIPVGSGRPDVCAVYPNYPGCPAVGFDATLTLPPSACARLLEIVALDSDGNTTVIGRRRLE